MSDNESLESWEKENESEEEEKKVDKKGHADEKAEMEIDSEEERENILIAKRKQAAIDNINRPNKKSKI